MKRNPGQWSIAFPLLDEDNAPAPFGRQSPRLLISACPLQAESVAALDGFPFVFLLAGKSHFRLKRKEKKKSPNLRCSFIPRLRTHPICPYPTGQNETVGSHDWDECDVADGGLQQLGIYYLDTGNGPFYQIQNHPPTILARYRFSVLSFNVFFFFFFWGTRFVLRFITSSWSCRIRTGHPSETAAVFFLRTSIPPPLIVSTGFEAFRFFPQHDAVRILSWTETTRPRLFKQQ